MLTDLSLGLVLVLDSLKQCIVVLRRRLLFVNITCLTRGRRWPHTCLWTIQLNKMFLSLSSTLLSFQVWHVTWPWVKRFTKMRSVWVSDRQSQQCKHSLVQLCVLRERETERGKAGMTLVSEECSTCRHTRADTIKLTVENMFHLLFTTSFLTFNSEQNKTNSYCRRMFWGRSFQSLCEVVLMEVVYSSFSALFFIYLSASPVVFCPSLSLCVLNSCFITVIM